VQRTNRNRIKLLVTLVLFMLGVTGAWLTSQADARGLSSPGASSHLAATRPGASLACGDPDAGQGVAPQPTPSTKQLSQLPSGPQAGGVPLLEWVRWTGRIWATLNLRAL
jgi:hypothetical protein